MTLHLFGESCHFACAGPDRGFALLLIHGAANDHDAWRDIMPTLAASGFRTIAPDLPGHGLSTGKPLDGIEQISDWVLALADVLGLERFAVAGHSMGSLVALETAARARQRVSHLLLLGTVVPMPVSAQLLETARSEPDTACRMVTDWSHTPSFLLTGGGGHGVWGPGKTLAVMRRNRATLAVDLANCNRYENGLDSASAVTCPTLLLIGRKDRMTPPRAAQPLHDALADASRHEIAECGHAMMVEKPQALAAAMIAFLG